jgi:hypothetical protein
MNFILLKVKIQNKKRKFSGGSTLTNTTYIRPRIEHSYDKKLVIYARDSTLTYNFIYGDGAGIYGWCRHQ